MNDDPILMTAPATALQTLTLPQACAAGVELSVLRLDQTDARVSGNKWFKLKYNIIEAQTQGATTLLSFGGAFSNHIHALAWAGKCAGLKTVGVIRGEPEYASNPTLSDAVGWGMELEFVSRSEYRQRYEPDYQASLLARYDNAYLIPEGGSNSLAVRGCQEIISADLRRQLKPDLVILACGTGATLAGIVAAHPDLNVLGIPVLKNADFLYDDIRQLLRQTGGCEMLEAAQNWRLDLYGHGGGYARTTPELLAFIEAMGASQQLPLDQVYTGKVLLRVMQLLEAGAFARGSRILIVHTGGLQGLRSLSLP